MRIYRNIEEIERRKKSVLTVGTFDGLHLGHQSILDQIKKIAAEKNLFSTIVTFDPHPRKVLGNPHGGDINLLTTTREKLKIFQEANIDQVLVIPFSKEFAAFSSREFVEQILVEKLAADSIVIGHDHHFGRNREGGFRLLEELGLQFDFSVYQVPEYRQNGELVSSSLIRGLLEAGNVEKTAEYMGRSYTITGTVIKGHGRGIDIGFPTANIEVDDKDKLIPARGVYAVDVMLDGRRFTGMMNIGTRPTFDFDSLTLEVHIFNFTAYIYGKALEVLFKKFIRPEKKFSGIEALRFQLQKDKETCENI
jgi:riboflavin kinase/FMN adenylyltransferase